MVKTTPKTTIPTKDVDELFSQHQVLRTTLVETLQVIELSLMWDSLVALPVCTNKIKEVLRATERSSIIDLR